MKTINDFIQELIALPEELKQLPVVIQTPYGSLFEPLIYRLGVVDETGGPARKQMIITHKHK